MPQAHRSDRNSVVTNQIAVTHSISSLFGSVRLVMASFSDSHIIASALRITYCFWWGDYEDMAEENF